ncbi:hypothetical protein [Paraburkholderia flagellata]|uniref:hypothetical protein n=1 Tax=Paraburkholderia flagellata TaxID=2883241 RepID=UPI001F159F72|nr:hypothetical protein [Paraburkholderia flagellata]
MYEGIANYIVGENLFFVPFLFLIFIKAMTMRMCWVALRLRPTHTIPQRRRKEDIACRTGRRRWWRAAPVRSLPDGSGADRPAGPVEQWG